MEVEGVEVVVVVAAVRRRVAVGAREGRAVDRAALAGVVADDDNLRRELGFGGRERQLDELHVLHLRRVEFEKGKVVHLVVEVEAVVVRRAEEVLAA